VLMSAGQNQQCQSLHKNFFCVVKHILLLRWLEVKVNKKSYHFGKIYAVYCRAKKIFCNRSPTSPYLRPKCVHEIFFKMNLHPEALIFGYFWLQKWIPRPKKIPGTNFHAFSCLSIHVATNFLNSGGKSPSSGQNFTSL